MVVVTNQDVLNACPGCNKSNVRYRKVNDNWICYDCKITFDKPVERQRISPDNKPWSRMKTIQEKTTLPTMEDIKRIATNIEDLRLRTLFVMGYLTGGRISELVSGAVKRSDLSIEEKNGRTILLIRMPNRKHRKKHFKDIPIPFDKEESFIRLIGDYVNSLEPEGALFPFGRSRAEQMLFKELNINPHWLRHVRASHLVIYYDFNEQLLTLYMGWSNSLPAKYYMELKWSDILQKL